MADICTSSHRVEHRVWRRDLALGILSRIQALAAMPGQWRQRAADLRHLRALDDHVLADIGLTRADVEREIHSPFWRPWLLAPAARHNGDAPSDPPQV